MVHQKWPPQLRDLSGSEYGLETTVQQDSGVAVLFSRNEMHSCLHLCLVFTLHAEAASRENRGSGCEGTATT